MYLPDFTLHQPGSLEEAGTLLARLGPGARLLAGGTDLLVDLKTGRTASPHLVSINRIAELCGLTETAAGLRIGALTTITQLDRAPLVRQRWSPLLDATREMAAPQIRNVATVGGNIASAVPCADLPPILIALHASVVLWSPGEPRTSVCADPRTPEMSNHSKTARTEVRGSVREVPLDTFFRGARQTVRRDDEVLTAVLVPRPPPGYGAAYARFALRDGNAIAVAAVAAAIRLDREHLVRDARIVLSAVAPIPLLIESAAAELLARRPNEDVFSRAAHVARKAAEPISDVRGSAEFRRELVAVLTRRALAVAHSRAQEAR